MLGIIIPIFNEVEILDLLHDRLRKLMDQLGEPACACLVDDGSSDGSLAKIKAFAEADSRFKYLSFSRNFGHQTAINAGLRELEADVYVIIDGDLQDPPELIPQLLAKWREGYEVVYCVRKDRKENIFMRACYSIFYRMLRRFSYLEIPLDTGDFSLLDRRVVLEMRRMAEHDHFIRGLRTWVGFRQIGFPYSRDARAGGTPKYTFGKLLGLAYNGIISFSFAPLKLAVHLGFFISALAFLGICALIIDKIFYGIPLEGWTSTAVLILFMGGVQLFTIGVLGEYVGRIFEEVKNRPLYVIKDKKI